ncbi:MAG: glycosyltransferase family 1 protein [Burkholderiaceae bacterium]
MKVVIVTDAWSPQVNGVVRTLQATRRELERCGHSVAMITPESFVTLPCPGYPEIRLSLLPYRKLARRLHAEFEHDGEVAVHVATEGPLGFAARRFCLRHRIPFTTAYHTRFPQYLRAIYGVPEHWTYAALRRFHAASALVMAATDSVEEELRRAGIERVARWTRGVDTDVFRPTEPMPLDLPRPVFAFVGRVSVEKNVEAFLQLDLPGSKVVAGDGPALPRLRRRHPEVLFLGMQDSEQLARLYSAADAFVFPSRTDTFGLVLLEALACGLPVAAYPVQGPLDVVGGSDVAVLDEDLRRAALAALRIDRARCRAFAMQRSWRHATRQFVSLLRPTFVRTARPLTPRVTAHATDEAGATRTRS